jgi:hypothetical protein
VFGQWPAVLKIVLYNEISIQQIIIELLQQHFIQSQFRTLRKKVIKIGAKVMRHSQYVVFQMTEVVVPKALFCEILNRIGQLRFNNT